MVRKVAQNWFLIALAACFWVGFQYAATISVALQWPYFRSGIVFAVMMATGMTLRPDAIRRSLRRPIAAVVSIASNTLLVPLLALSTYWILPSDLYGGLFVASLVPCTIASASVWTRRAGGDDSIAILTTLTTNLACFVVVPAGLAMVLAKQTEISAGAQVFKLATIVVAPLVLAQLVRRRRLSVGTATKTVGDWADDRKVLFSVVAQFGILAMVMLGGARTSETMSVATEGSAGSLFSFASLIGSVLWVHLAAMGAAIALARGLGVDRPGQIACGISGSQKTFVIGLQIAIDCGVSVLPMLVYHAGQLLIDTIIADRWKSNSENGKFR